MISGYTITRDCVTHDYCFEECIRSMLPFCDEVVVGDAMSTDGTRERVLAIDQKVRIVDCERRENIVNQPKFMAEWINQTRASLKYDYSCFLDADEVIPPESIQGVLDGMRDKVFVKMNWLNFFSDTKTLVPKGEATCYRKDVSGPSQCFWFGDSEYLYPDKKPEAPRRDVELFVFHYGYLRKPDALFKKSRFLQTAILGHYDQRLVKAEESNIPWQKLISFNNPLGQYDGPHPEVAHEWLKQRGYNP